MGARLPMWRINSQLRGFNLDRSGKGALIINRGSDIRTALVSPKHLRHGHFIAGSAGVALALGMSGAILATQPSISHPFGRYGELSPIVGMESQTTFNFGSSTRLRYARDEAQVSLGSGDDETPLRRIRLYAYFAEHVPPPPPDSRRNAGNVRDGRHS
mgnify:FL=1|tara:strand:- start:4131 stop:4604 length:474 start_codon:yes stop_codon:yes gene_type:complete